jgi:hypothetical protein
MVRLEYLQIWLRGFAQVSSRLPNISFKADGYAAA